MLAKLGESPWYHQPPNRAHASGTRIQGPFSNEYSTMIIMMVYGDRRQVGINNKFIELSVDGDFMAVIDFGIRKGKFRSNAGMPSELGSRP